MVCVRENAPLRAVISGHVVSVPENFYDSYLLAAFESLEEEVREGMLIGRVLDQQLGVWDDWLHVRIGKLMETGKIRMVSGGKADHPYSRVIRRNK